MNMLGLYLLLLQEIENAINIHGVNCADFLDKPNRRLNHSAEILKQLMRKDDDIIKPPYQLKYFKSISMRWTCFKEPIEVQFFDPASGQSCIFFPTPNMDSYGSMARVYHLKTSRKSIAGFTTNEILYKCQAKINFLAKIQAELSQKRSDYMVKALKLEDLMARQILGKGGYAHVSLGRLMNKKIYVYKYIFIYFEFIEKNPQLCEYCCRLNVNKSCFWFKKK